MPSISKINLQERKNTQKLKQDIKNNNKFKLQNKLNILNEEYKMLISQKIKELTNAELESICFTLKNMYFNINGTGDFENAQVTCGGAVLDEFTSNLESKKCKGLYAIGEVLDVDGKCGGYNLSWAFNSALIVSNIISKK